MQFFRKPFFIIFAVCAMGQLAATHAHASLFHHKKYENPIAKDTLQPDKVLFDRSIVDIEHGRFEVARLTLNTLINTYDSSEYLAKAKLAIADSWYREGGAHGLAQAEAEYKDFELFYPAMEESSEAQWRVCQIHYKQMEKVDRDNTQALRAEDECRQMMTAYPNSRYAAQATQMLRSVQEVLAEKEFLAGDFYHHKGAFPAAENRLAFAAQQYPLFSHADDALWEQADSFHHMGDRFEDREADALTKIVRDYPLSDHVEDSKQRLEELKKPVPAADPAAYERQKYEMDAMRKPGLFNRSTSLLRRGPDTYMAAKTGSPAMATLRPPTPVSVPVQVPAGDAPESVTGQIGSGVTGSVVTGSSAIDTKTNQLQPGVGAAGSEAKTGSEAEAPAKTAAPVIQAPPPTNHPNLVKRKLTKKQKKAQDDAAAAAAAAAAKPAPPAPPEATTPATEMRGTTSGAGGDQSAMTRILLAEHSPHAQRMAERILREEGYTVITVSDGDTALLRLKDTKPQLIFADVALSGHTGFQICEFVRSHPEFLGTAVVLCFGALDRVDDQAVKRVSADGVLRKPFEATELLKVAARYATAAKDTYIIDRTGAGEQVLRPSRTVVVLDPEQVRAAVTVALDEALEPLISRVTERVMAVLSKR